VKRDEFTWIAKKEDSGLTLVAFVQRYLPGVYSARFIKRAIESNHAKINGRIERFGSASVMSGDTVSFFISVAHQVSKNFDSSHILFEDDFLFIYNKPAGISCDESGMIRFVHEYNPSLHLVHRLDKDTTGVLLFAKQKEILSLLIDQFKDFKIEKKYNAIVDGVIQQEQGVIENYLGKKRDYAGQTLWGSLDSSQGLFACTRWERIKIGDHATFVNCYPKTGRTHQLRVHMAEMGHPIVGDFQYGMDFTCPYHPSSILLHAEEISFLHPKNEKRMVVIAPRPSAFCTAEEVIFRRLH
jgi:RluA family pseudouridine synthase